MAKRKKKSATPSIFNNLLPKKLTQNPISFLFIAVAALFLTYCHDEIPNITPTSTQNTNNPVCLSHFYQATAPELINDALKQANFPLCYQGFALNYSGVSKTPLWVAEYLTPERLASKIKRQDNFHEEERIPEQYRSRLEDYRGSGYDRGHMAPNGDMTDEQTQFESFSLANMVPQTPANNQQTWRMLEEATRSMVSKYQLNAYIVTGPAFLNKTVKYSKKGAKVLVPSHIYKAVYFPQVGMASAYFTPNDASHRAELISICALEDKLGINLYPQMTEAQKRQVYQLPLQASDVKANRQPRQLAEDTRSQCADKISESQLKQTQQIFSAQNQDFIASSQIRSKLNESIPNLNGEAQLNKILTFVIKQLQQSNQS